jgi:hypothetical protein
MMGRGGTLGFRDRGGRSKLMLMMLTRLWKVERSRRV